ncbi:thioredoxin domain-containing protein [Paenibacillus sp. HJL G12]|uniref:Thioredoxin domain-containing protein n=1 Tax=Paenibacillus dendrobii TaxID=2691084 RepID=A0A7X3IPQ0_9BACL|nr:DsbA family oxidoreductase [Paenibacillus dendrobii]MWV45947.1 thioredoxin domain-containing protein [Paenibacillus dendrobii]
MKIEVWSDFACPFCYIGKRRFEAALERFEHKNEVEVVFRSFELDPNAPRENEHDMHTLLASKYGMSVEKAKSMNENMTEQAKAVGLTYRFDTMKVTNTFDAHRLTHWAGESGKRYEMTERLFKAYFTDSEHLGDRATLARLAGEIGLDTKAAADMLESDAYEADVREDESQATKLGISGVPFFVVNQKYGISGAQPEDVFAEALEKIWKEDHPLTMVGGSDDLACQDGSCALPDKE